MISADEARALINRKSYEEKIKEYEEKIEKDIVKTAKNNESMIFTTYGDKDPLFQEAFGQVLTNLVYSGFNVSYSWIGCHKCIVSICW